MIQEKTKVERDYEEFQAEKARQQRMKDRDVAYYQNLDNMAAASVETLRQQAAAKEKAAIEQAETDFMQSVCDAFIAAGGDAKMFPIEWPSLRAEIVRSRTLERFTRRPTAADIAKATLDELYRGNPTATVNAMSVITPE